MKYVVRLFVLPVLIVLTLSGCTSAVTTPTVSVAPTAECVKRLRQLAAEFRVELNGLNRRSRLLSETQAVELWTTLRCAPSCPQAPPRRLRRMA